MHPGLFITLEGGEGAGKSTVLAAIRSCLQEAGIPHRLTREPGGTELGEALRSVVLDPRYAGICPESELLLMFASRAQLVCESILPALAAGEWVVSDRFTDASFAYQGGGRGVPLALIEDLERWAAFGLKPQRTFLLDVPVAVGLERVAGRGGCQDRMERESLGFFERVREAYLERARTDPSRIERIDAALPPAAVAAQVTGSLRAMIAAWRGASA
jgi:dTMP kinase